MRVRTLSGDENESASVHHHHDRDEDEEVDEAMAEKTGWHQLGRHHRHPAVRWLSERYASWNARSFLWSTFIVVGIIASWSVSAVVTSNLTSEYENPWVLTCKTLRVTGVVISAHL